MITLTPKAAEKVRRQLEIDGKTEGFLKLKVSAGGCSGMNYEFEFTADKTEGDKLFESEGAKVLVEPKAYFFVNGATIDWHETLMEAGFRVKNPNATDACNCGTSFSTF